MRVIHIALENFRSYGRAEASFSPGINVVTGENAQGKTNLLEAVYLLAGGKSFRTRTDRELIRFGAEFAGLRAGTEARGREQTVEIFLEKGRKKQIRLNGVKRTAAELSENLSAVLFCPDDLNVVREGAAARRRLMDMAVSQLRPGYAALISEYARLFEHKTRILRDWREKPRLLDLLDEISDQLCLCSARVIRYRAAFVKKLEAAAGPIHAQCSAGREALSLTYKTVSTVTDAHAGTEALYGEILDHYRAHRDAELKTGTCLTGAHKDDIEIGINGVSARSFASQGQARTAALAIKLAEREIHLAESGEYPVLLLDDVLSELDETRQEFVLNRIGGGQTLVTCCGDGRIKELTGGRVFVVKDGVIAG